MKISYDSNKMEKILCDEQLIKKEYGTMAQKVINGVLIFQKILELLLRRLVNLIEMICQLFMK